MPSYSLFKIRKQSTLLIFNTEMSLGLSGHVITKLRIVTRNSKVFPSSRSRTRLGNNLRVGRVSFRLQCVNEHMQILGLVALTIFLRYRTGAVLLC